MNTRRFSRHLPPAPVHLMPVAGWIVLALAAAGVIILTFFYVAFVAAFFLVVIGGGKIIDWFESRRLRKLAATRPGDPLSAFARAMNVRTVDPWVVRAAFEALQRYFPVMPRPFPLQPADRLLEDLHIHPDDADSIARDIAARAGYSLDDFERNPLYDKVHTVGDLIRFFTHQPKTRRP